MSHARGSGAMRLRGLFKKERLQIQRDPSSIALALVMPLVLLFLFGYGVSLDAENVHIALVVEDSSEAARELAARFELTRYFEPLHCASMREAEERLRAGEVDGILRIRSDFTEGLAARAAGPRAGAAKVDGATEAPRAAPVQLVLNGVDSNRARLVEGYVQSTVQTFAALGAERGELRPGSGAVLESRIWFNESVDSTAYLVPGLLTLVMTLIGVLLTALVIAREWERGTMEAMLSTPLRIHELMLGKLLPYLGLGLIGMLLSVGLGVAVFHVPFRGSFGALLLTATLFLLASLGLGLFISAAVRIQFVAAQISIVTGFLPAFFLSGLLFDLESTPLPIRIISHLVPARYFVTISHTLFLAGDVWSVLLPNAAVLALMAAVTLTAARTKLGLRLRGRT